MIEVTAAIARESPNLRSQMLAARSIGSNGRSSGLRTGTPYRARRGAWPTGQRAAGGLLEAETLPGVAVFYTESYGS